MDICKAILLFILILGSTDGIPEGLRIIIFSFHIPLLFFTEGAKIDGNGIKENFNLTLKELIKPYAVTAVLMSLLTALLHTADINSAGAAFLFSLDDFIVCMSNASGIFTKYKLAGLIWLIPSLAVTKMVVVILNSAFRKVPWWVKAAVTALVSFAGVIVSSKVGFLPWSFDVAITMTVFTAAGEALKKREYSFKSILVAGASALLIWGILLKNYVQIDITARRYPYGVLCFICAFSACIVMCAVSVLIKKIPVLSGILKYIGGNFILLFCIYCLELRFFNWNDWVYKPLGIAPGWIVSYMLRIFLTALTAALVFLIRRCADRLSASLVKEDNTGRLEWPDLAKGFCMISIILGHCGIDWINQIVFIYDLPVFFLIAGYFLKKKEFVPFVKNKALRLLVPYYATCMGICLGKAILSYRDGTSVLESLKQSLLASLYAAGDSWTYPVSVRGIGAIWFLWALFISLVITNFFIGKKLSYVIIPCISFAGWYSFYKTGIWLPLSVQSGMLASLYLLIGYESRRCGLDLKKVKPVPLAVALLVTAYGMQHFKGFWLVHDYMGNGWLDFFVSIAASYAVISFCIYISGKDSLLKAVLRFFGKNSLTVLCFHVLEMEVVPLGDLNLKISSALSLNPLYSVLMFIILKIVFCGVMTLLLVKGKERWSSN